MTRLGTLRSTGGIGESRHAIPIDALVNGLVPSPTTVAEDNKTYDCGPPWANVLITRGNGVAPRPSQSQGSPMACEPPLRGSTRYSSDPRREQTQSLAAEHRGF